VSHSDTRLRVRAFAIATKLLLLAVLFSACAEAPWPPPFGFSTDSTPPQSPTILLRVAGRSATSAEQEFLDRTVTIVEATAPNAQITLQLEDDYDAYLQEAIENDSLPDIFFVSGHQLPLLVRSGLVSPVPDRWLPPQELYSHLRPAFTVGGKYFCLPRDASTLGLAYNQSLFDAAGIPYPTDNWTWSDLKEAAATLTDANRGIYGLVLAADTSRWLPFLYQAGGVVVTPDGLTLGLDSPAGNTAMAYFISLFDEGLAVPPNDVDSLWSGEAFAKGYAAMVIEGPWLLSYLADNAPQVPYGLVHLPAGPAGRATLAFTNCLAVASASRNQAAAFELAYYLTTGQVLTGWLDAAGALPVTEPARSEWPQRYPALAPFVTSLAYAQPWQFPFDLYNFPDSFNTTLRAGIAGELTPAEVVERAAETAAAMMAAPIP
jgi:multiple sugar transport system substrate-binding protein